MILMMALIELDIMNDHHEKILEEDYQKLLKMLGSFIRDERRGQGYKDADDFATIIDTDGASVRKYENGRTGITLKTFHKIYRNLGKNSEDIFTSLVTHTQNELNPKKFKLPYDLELQVKTQVKETFPSISDSKLNTERINKLYLMLIFCLKEPLKRSKIKERFDLKEYTDTFNDALDVAKDTKWIRLTNPDSKNAPNQSYQTTEAGIEVLKLRGKEENDLDALVKIASLVSRIAELESENEKLREENERLKE